MTSTKTALNILTQILEDTEVTDERDKKFLKFGLTPEDRKVLDFGQVKNVGELIKILDKVDKDTPIVYDYATVYLALNKNEDGLFLYVSE